MVSFTGLFNGPHCEFYRTFLWSLAKIIQCCSNFPPPCRIIYPQEINRRSKMVESPYSTPKSEVLPDVPLTVRIMTRKKYFCCLILVWVIIPAIASLVVVGAGWGQGGIRSFTSSTGSSGYTLDFFYVWYISLPIFIFFTYKRVKDAGMSGWFTVLFSLPIINFAIWFWPPDYP